MISDQWTPPGFDEDRDCGNEPEPERTEAEIEEDRARWAAMINEPAEF